MSKEGKIVFCTGGGCTAKVAEPYSGKAAARCKRPEPSGRVRQPG